MCILYLLILQIIYLFFEINLQQCSDQLDCLTKNVIVTDLADGGTNINININDDDDFQQPPPHSSIFGPGSDGDGGKTEADNNMEHGDASSEAAAAAVAADDLARAIEAGDLASVTTLVEDGVSVTAPLDVGLWTDHCEY